MHGSCVLEENRRNRENQSALNIIHQIFTEHLSLVVFFSRCDGQERASVSLILPSSSVEHRQVKSI